MPPMTIRPAIVGEAAVIARFIIMAGGGMFEFLLDGVQPGARPVDMLRSFAREPEGTFSFQQCRMAEVDGNVIGMINVYPADWLRLFSFDGLPADRAAHLAPFKQVQDWGSFYVSALAVHPSHRRLGIARALLHWASQTALRQGYPRTSLHVWTDNTPAIELYRSEGFHEIATVPIAAHPRLPHEGGMRLMSRQCQR